jgi:hypothetical protein
MLKVQKRGRSHQTCEPILARNSVNEIQCRGQSLGQDYPQEPKPFILCHGISMLLMCLLEASARG